MRKKDLGIYIHIPFCVRKCLYCDFCSMPASDDIKKNYVNKLINEIGQVRGKYQVDSDDYIVKTVYFGGGTPSCLQEDYIRLILCKLRETFRFSEPISPDEKVHKENGLTGKNSENVGKGLAEGAILRESVGQTGDQEGEHNINYVNYESREKDACRESGRQAGGQSGDHNDYYVNYNTQEKDACRESVGQTGDQEGKHNIDYVNYDSPEKDADRESGRRTWDQTGKHNINYVNFDDDKASKEGCEITIEVNPGTVTREKLKAYRKAGINRLSIGLQSADDRELRLLGRVHNFRDFLDSYQMALEEGFNNVSADLMTALPGQTKDTLKNSLCKLISLHPKHISAYSLILEEGTPFYNIYGGRNPEIPGARGRRENSVTEDREEIAGGQENKENFTAGGDKGSYGSEDRKMSFGSENSRETGWSDKELVYITNMLEKLKLPGEEEEREMYALVRDTLKDAGYRQYEISNFSLPGYESRHNTSYWKRTPYLGFGLGASSFVNDRRLKNTMVLQEYLRTGEKRDSFAENLLVSRKEAMEETMFLGLRMTEGVSRTAFQKDFGTELEAVYGKEISKLISEKLIEEEGDFLRLTERGVDYGNYVFSRFFL